MIELNGKKFISRRQLIVCLILYNEMYLFVKIFI